jgi:hypothetical protein
VRGEGALAEVLADDGQHLGVDEAGQGVPGGLLLVGQQVIQAHQAGDVRAGPGRVLPDKGRGACITGQGQTDGVRVWFGAMTTAKKIAVVTGASRGIGRALVQSFVKEGYEVWALARAVDALEQLARESGGAVRPLAIDVADEAAVIAASQRIREAPPSR